MVTPPPLAPLPRLRPGKSVKDALDYAGVTIRPGMTMGDVRKAVSDHARENDPRRSGEPITTVEQAERAINHWATAPYANCGNYGLGMTTCEAVTINGDCPRTKYCVFAESTRDAVGRDHWGRKGFATDVEAAENGIEMDLCPYWDPDERGIDNTDDYLLPTPGDDQP